MPSWRLLGDFRKKQSVPSFSNSFNCHNPKSFHLEFWMKINWCDLLSHTHIQNHQHPNMSSSHLRTKGLHKRQITTLWNKEERVVRDSYQRIHLSLLPDNRRASTEVPQERIIGLHGNDGSGSRFRYLVQKFLILLHNGIKNISQVRENIPCLIGSSSSLGHQP